MMFFDEETSGDNVIEVVSVVVGVIVDVVVVVVVDVVVVVVIKDDVTKEFSLSSLVFNLIPLFPMLK